MPPRLPRLTLRQLAPKPCLGKDRDTLSRFPIPIICPYQLRRPLPHNDFTTTTFLSGKKKSKESQSRSEAPANGADTEVVDPFDFSVLKENIEKSRARLDRELQELKSGGRISSDVIDEVRVTLSKDRKGTVRLGDLAQVIPKGGRSLTIMVGEAEHVKPINTALLASRMNLNPQTDPHNTLQLNVPIPPPTSDARVAAIEKSRRVEQDGLLGINNARAIAQKSLRDMQLKKAVRPDDLKKAHKIMEGIIQTANQSIKKAADDIREGLKLQPI